MKFSREWGSGRTIVRENILRSIRRRPRFGGSGMVVGRDDKMFGGYSLKLVGFLEKDGDLNGMFWEEARSVSLYTSIPQNIPGCVKCPLPASYWIREDDPLYREFLRSGKCAPSPRLLIDFISIFGIEPEQLAPLGIDDPGAYRLAPSPLLEEIRGDWERARTAKKKGRELRHDLLMAYPIARGSHSLAESAGAFDDPSEVLRMVCHILSAILALYRKGLAHGDVKPANIMRPFLPRSTGQAYFLTDIGSLHAGDMSSATGSAMFFAHDVFRKWRKEPDKTEQNRRFIGKDGFEPDTPCSGEVLNRLLRRTLMDGHALAVTIWSLALGRAPARPLRNLRLVDEKWHCGKLTKIFDTLYDVKTLSIGRMREIADDLKNEFPYHALRSPCIETYGREAEIKFDVERIENISGKVKIEYGKLSEQLSFGKRSTPMLRFCGGDRRIPHLPQEILLQPVIEAYSCGNKLVGRIFYAPDDAETGSRTVDFEKYQPCSLAYLLDHGGPTEQDVARITALGRLIDTYRTVHGGSGFLFTPYPNDIVRVGGDWMIMPVFLGSMFVFCPMSFEEYFKMLCGRENGLSAQNWADLLDFDHGVGILFELLPEDMAPRVAELLDDASSVDPESLADRDERRWIERLHRLRRLLLTCKSAKFAGRLEPERQDPT